MNDSITSGRKALRAVSRMHPAGLLIPAMLALALPIAGCGEAPAPQAPPPHVSEGAPTDYLEAIPIFWHRIYPEGGQTLYCGERFDGGSRRTDTGRALNIEHVMPMAWVGNDLECGDRDRCRDVSDRFRRIEADFHNLYPARRDVNRLRGASAFAELPRGAIPFSGCEFELDERRRLVEPRTPARGRIARAMLYMEATYDVPIFERQRRLLLDWDARYPPDAAERARHARIVALTGRANPFVTRWARADTDE